mmetsp:Transcript_47223/g.100451  ORF Transcript_47223/g.100451 Transcript_47223/m.100451 type:complete len:265 (+) Transcript_47223:225-1019(+)
MLLSSTLQSPPLGSLACAETQSFEDCKTIINACLATNLQPRPKRGEWPQLSPPATGTIFASPSLPLRGYVLKPPRIHVLFLEVLLDLKHHVVQSFHVIVLEHYNIVEVVQAVLVILLAFVQHQVLVAENILLLLGDSGGILALVHDEHVLEHVLLQRRVYPPLLPVLLYHHPVLPLPPLAPIVPVVVPVVRVDLGVHLVVALGYAPDGRGWGRLARGLGDLHRPIGRCWTRRPRPRQRLCGIRGCRLGDRFRRRPEGLVDFDHG